MIRGLIARAPALESSATTCSRKGLLRLGDGEVFHGEGILAVTKALLQSGVAYIGGYQGAPMSHLLDVAVQSREYLNGLGVHVEACTGEASAAVLLGASINHPVRGAVTWKSIVGTNAASDALSNVASAGVVGGTLIVLGEDYGEGASVIQERSHAIAMKSSMWLLDPRSNPPTIVRLVEKAFDLSEASSTPTMMELRIRACHLHGTFTARANRERALSRNKRIHGPPELSCGCLADFLERQCTGRGAPGDQRCESRNEQGSNGIQQRHLSGAQSIGEEVHLHVASYEVTRREECRARECRGHLQHLDVSGNGPSEQLAADLATISKTRPIPGYCPDAGGS